MFSRKQQAELLHDISLQHKHKTDKAALIVFKSVMHFIVLCHCLSSIANEKLILSQPQMLQIACELQDLQM